MSGTSLDGVDAALLTTDGEAVAVPGAALTLPYEAGLRVALRAAIAEAREVAEGAPVPHSIREAERRVTEAHAAAVKALLAKGGLACAVFL
jgi:anhydro-N-acetylmuramic acid kinase